MGLGITMGPMVTTWVTGSSRFSTSSRFVEKKKKSRRKTLYKVTYHWEICSIPGNDTYTDGDWYGILRKGRKILAKGNRIYLQDNYMRKHKINAEEVYKY